MVCPVDEDPDLLTDADAGVVGSHVGPDLH